MDLFKNHFAKHVKVRPCILLYDGRSTHINADINEAARKEGVHLFVLPPHSSHVLQPLDMSVFSAFKKSLNSKFHKYLRNIPYSIITIDLLPELISNSYKASMRVSTIMSGFRKTGIFPLDPSAPVNKVPNVDTTERIVNTKITRKERKDNRNVRNLLEEKSNSFHQAKEENINKKRKRKSFIPPYGADITHDDIYKESKKRKEEKEKWRRKGRVQEQGLSRKQSKVANKFVPPFIVIDDKEDSSPVIQKDRKGNDPTLAATKERIQLRNIKYQHFQKTLKKTKKIVLFVENGNLMGLGLTFH